ncbi:MAG: IclR family transcriptional regulator [Corynebacteriales bacterium]|uniref:Glycerol operon regulatory protein n=1 Tax=Williamsia herbipolensis TaxID=1603258 RepID=A0AAU4K391_9NOCA|nr:IclR family transcriptional regulator [Williamsia herbipolensis]MCX6471499.1 IclR family transcriptional regulator [Mycobacteriales bacterium]
MDINDTADISPDRNRPASIQSVDRALEVLEILARHGEGGVSDIADTLGVHKSTISRLVSVLEGRGFVEQVADRGKYRLGFTIVRLAGATMATRDLGRESRDIAGPLAEAVGETVNLAILDSGRAVNVTEANGSPGISLRTWVGQSCPAHATSSGKVLLAALDDTRLDMAVGTTLERFTSSTIGDLDALRAELGDIRRRGWAHAREELEEGLTAVAAPIRDHTGDVVAALSISGPTFRMSDDRLPTLSAEAVDAADAISVRLGHRA